MKKNFITGIILGSIISGAAGVFAGQYMATSNPFPVQLNGNNISLEGYNINDNTYFKLRDIADYVGGFTVGFNNNTIQLTEGEPGFYEIESILPSFKYHTNAVQLSKYFFTEHHYTATQEQVEQYKKVLVSHGFQPGIFRDCLSYVKDEYMITIVESTDEDYHEVVIFCRCEPDLLRYFTPAN